MVLDGVLGGHINLSVWLNNEALIMDAVYVGGLGVLFLRGLSHFVVGFLVVVTRGCGELLVGDILHQCSHISRSCVVDVAGEEVGKGGERLVQVLTKLVAFTLDGSGGWLLVGG